MMQKIIKIIKKNNIASNILSFIYTDMIGLNRIHGRKRNKIILHNCFLKKCTIKIRGFNNQVIINNQSKLINCKISIVGNNNTVIIGERVSSVKCEIYMEDDYNSVVIGNQSHLCGFTHLACIEGCNIIIGEKCLFSSDVTFRTGDSHSIIDLEGNRINPSQNINIGDHVWIGNKTIITKGVRIAENCIIATGAVVTNKFDEANTIIGGVPAKIIKKNVNWDEARI